MTNKQIPTPLVHLNAENSKHKNPHRKKNQPLSQMSFQMKQLLRILMKISMIYKIQCKEK